MRQLALIVVFSVLMPIPAVAADLYVATKGNDAWSGKLADPSADGKDGPVASIPAALKIARELRAKQPVTIHLRGGTYFLPETLKITPEMTGVMHIGRRKQKVRASKTLTFKAYKDEAPILSGGRRITGFKAEKVNERAAWVAVLPEAKAGKWYFRQLWVNGERRHRARLPKKGLYKIDRERQKRTGWKGTDRFAFANGHIRGTWRNLNDVELSIFHVWLNSRLPIKSVDQKNKEVICQYPTTFGGLDHAAYFVDNVFEAMTEPGQWYLDRPTGKLYYLPTPGEKIETAEVIAPALKKVMVIAGADDGKDPVQNVRFENVRFSHNEHRLGFHKSRPSAQAAWEVGGAVSVSHARNISFQKCRIEHTGTYGLELGAKTWEVTVDRCVVRDVGAGGVKIWHGSERALVTDSDIYDGGHVYHQGVGVLVGRASGNRILHCNIHDFDYSGISAGWNWGPGDNCYGNVIERNHIYNIGRGMLSDMAGIYFLGKQNGTRVRFNVIHDVYCRIYGGWGIYGDGWASGILFENNLIYNTTTGAFHTNVGVDLQFRNNIFAFGKLHQLSFGYPGAPHEVLLDRTIILADGRNLTNGDWGQMKQVRCRNNIIWDLKKGPKGIPPRNILKGLGADNGTIYADPMFVDPKKGDFRLKKGSPALKMGFVPFDYKNVGPRAESKE